MSTRTRLWLSQIPSTDPAFAQLEWAVANRGGAEAALLRLGHGRAWLDAAWGMPLDALETEAEQLRADATDNTDKALAVGYAPGVTAVRVAIAEHAEETADMGRAA